MFFLTRMALVLNNPLNKETKPIWTWDDVLTCTTKPNGQWRSDFRLCRAAKLEPHH